MWSRNLANDPYELGFHIILAKCMGVAVDVLTMKTVAMHMLRVVPI